MSIESASRKLIREFTSRTTVRAGSLITTVFGDAIAPRGGSVWLGSLIRVMADFGISERLVRTSVFRLVQDGWLQSVQVGRRSYYCLTDVGRERFEQATHRIYGRSAADWNKTWCVLLLSNLATSTKESVRKECSWLGFGALSTDMLAHPSPDMSDLDMTLHRLAVVNDIVVMNAQTLNSETAMRTLAHASWNLDEIDQRYAAFTAHFRPLIAAFAKSKDVSPKTAFLLRTLLIQEYRKILLRDPQLPVELLPTGWHGAAAYQLCRNLYLAIYNRADEYLSATMETAEGPLPPPAGHFMQRFGGLQ